MYLRVVVMFILAAVGGLAADAVAQQAVGSAERVQQGTQQTVLARTGGLAEGDDVFQQARLLTDETGSGLVRFEDGTGLTIAKNSDVVVDEFVYNPGGRQSMALRLGAGAMRFVSGRIQREAVQVRTSVAVLGIRGTDFTIDRRLPNLLRMWLEEGALVITAADSGLVFEFEAPARADCTPIACRTLAFSPPPRAFEPGPAQEDDDEEDPFGPGGNDGGNDGGDGNGGGGGNGGRG